MPPICFHSGFLEAVAWYLLQSRVHRGFGQQLSHESVLSDTGCEKQPRLTPCPGDEDPFHTKAVALSFHILEGPLSSPYLLGVREVAVGGRGSQGLPQHALGIIQLWGRAPKKLCAWL